MSTRSALSREMAVATVIIGCGIAACGVGACGIAALALWRRAQTYRRDWQESQNILPAAPSLESEDRLLIVAPHPDDEVLATGALIHQARRQNLEVCVVFLTNGDGSGSAYLAQQWREGRRPNFQQLAATRQNEARAALKCLGVAADDIVFLGYPDGGLGAMREANFNSDAPFSSKWTQSDGVPYSNAFSPRAPYAGENVVRDLTAIFAQFSPTRIYTTDEHDTHTDHIAAYDFAKKALRIWRAAQKNATSSTRSGEETRFFTHLIHHHIWPVPHGRHCGAPLSPPAILSHLNWTHFSVDDETLNSKERALQCYESQLLWTPHYLRSFLRRTEMFREIE